MCCYPASCGYTGVPLMKMSQRSARMYSHSISKHALVWFCIFSDDCIWVQRLLRGMWSISRLLDIALSRIHSDTFSHALFYLNPGRHVILWDTLVLRCQERRRDKNIDSLTYYLSSSHLFLFLGTHVECVVDHRRGHIFYVPERNFWSNQVGAGLIGVSRRTTTKMVTLLRRHDSL